MSPLAVLLILISLFSYSEAGASIHVNDFGAVADDGRNDLDAFLAAAAFCKMVDNPILVFGPGRYDLRSDDADHPLPFRLLNFSNIASLTIDGSDSILVCHKPEALFYFNKCPNLTLKNVIIDYDPLYFSAGQIEGKTDKALVVKLISPPPVPGMMKVQGVLQYDPNKRRPADGGWEYFKNDRPISFDPTGNLLIPKHPEAEIDDYVLIRHHISPGNVFLILESNKVLIQHVTIYGGIGMGVFAAGCQDVMVDGLVIQKGPSNERWLSTARDALHFNSCREQITVSHCRLEGMGDDGINVHSQYLSVSEVLSPRQFRLRNYKAPVFSYLVPQIGDTLELSHLETPFTPYGQIKVAEKSKENGGKSVLITLKEDLPQETRPDDLAVPIENLPKLSVGNSVIRNNRGRGILVQTRVVLIEGCRFENQSGGAIHLRTDARRGREAAGTRKVNIRKNVFEGCNAGVTAGNGVLDIFANVFPGSVPESLTHQDILIEDNEFDLSSRASIYVSSSTRVTIRGNQFIKCPDPPIRIDGARDVTIEDNTQIPNNVGR